jgi:ribosome-associated protein
VSSDKERSQFVNKNNAINKIYELITSAFKLRKYRHKTLPTFNSKEQRLSNKKINSQKKSLRKKDYDDDL